VAAVKQNLNRSLPVLTAPAGPSAAATASGIVRDDAPAAAVFLG
jgi:hypothetical protein